MNTHSLDAILRELRESFDSAFTRERTTVRETTEDYLLLRTTAETYALSTRQVRTLVRCPQITPLPGQRSAVVGLVGVRGSLTSVYDLEALLGGARTSSDAGWLVIPTLDASVALLVADQPVCRRVTKSAIRPLAGGGHTTSEPHSGGVILFEDASALIVDASMLMELVHLGGESGNPSEERRR